MIKSSAYRLRHVMTSRVQERPYHNKSTASRLLSEVKYCQALLVLQWGTMLESWVLFFLYYSCEVPSHEGPHTWHGLSQGHLKPLASQLIIGYKPAYVKMVL